MVDQWFRLYNSMRHDRKVRKLSDAEFRAWILLLSVASEEGGKLPVSPADLAMELHLSEVKASAMLRGLIDVGLFDLMSDGNVTPHNWDNRQFKSDASRERQRRYRDRHRNVTPNVTVTLQETETETETETEKKVVDAHSRAPRPKGTRWPSQAVVSEAWKQAASEKRASSSLPSIDMDLTAEQFANYWSSRADRGATKLDWERTWMNWATTQKAQANGSRRTGSAHANFAAGALAAAAEFDKSH